MAELWIIKFEDADVEDHIFIGDTAEEDSRRVFLSASESWNCHLFGPAEEITLLRQKLATLTASNEALLAQVTWTRIDAEHLPTMNDEVGGYRPKYKKFETGSVGAIAASASVWNDHGWTHYRPKNAPTECP